MPRFPLWALLAVIGLTSAAPPAPAPPPVPLCRVEATTRPLWFASTIRQITVRLVPECEGIARVRLGGYGGPGSRATGPTETLSPARPVVVWSAQPPYRTVLWIAASGTAYPVPLNRGVRPNGPGAR